MTKSRWKKDMKFLGSTHIDPEKGEELKKTKIEIDDNVTRILKLIKNRKKGKKDGNPAKDSEIVELIEDFHKQYRELYALYDSLREEVREKVHRRENKESYSSPSGSDTESEIYYSPGEASVGRSSPASDSQRGRDDSKLRHETSSSEFIDLRSKFASVSEEKEALHSEYMASLSKIKESEKIIEDLRSGAEQTESEKQKLLNECTQLRGKLAEREKHYSLSGALRVPEIEAPTKESEMQVSSLKLEQQNLYAQKRQLEEQIGGRDTEAKRLGEENLELQDPISELERTSKEREEKLSALVRKLEENESHSASKIEELTAQVDNLQLEINTLRTRKGELEEQLVFNGNEATAQLKSVKNQVDVLQQDLHHLSSQKSESESCLEKVTQEISDFLTQIDNLKEELESKSMDLQRMLEEKDGLARQVKDLELEAGSLRSQKGEIEEHMRTKNREADQLRVEKQGLVQELESLQTEKRQLESQLMSRIEEYETSLKGQEDVIDKLKDEHKQIRGRFLESKLNYRIAEKKIEETAEEFCKKLEDSLRILSRRIRVAEQLHLENKDVYGKTREKYEKENMELNLRIVTTEVQVKRMKEISQTTNEMLNRLDTVALKFEECSGNFLNRISKVSCEVLFAKEWAKRKSKAMKHVEEDIDCVLAQLDTKEAEILEYREKVWKLEQKNRELEKVVKDREEGMLVLGEEKREAIRQLCVWIDYHRSRSDYLKKILSEMNAARSRRTS